MEDYIKEAVETYQCPGCVGGSDISCYQNAGAIGMECTKHVPGTMIMPVIGTIFLGMPREFNRQGPYRDMKLCILNTPEEYGYDKFNIPCWKYFDEHGNTLVRGLRPRLNEGFLHVILGDNLNEIDCLEITDKDREEMD